MLDCLGAAARLAPIFANGDPTSTGEGIEGKLTTGIIGLLAGVVGSFIGFHLWPAWRRRSIRRRLAAEPEAKIKTGNFGCRIANGSSYTMGKVVAYITIDHEAADILDPPADQSAHHSSHNPAILREAQLCWAVQEGGQNPMRVDIYAGERQPLPVGVATANHIMIYSERVTAPARVYLRRKVYTGKLKLVCADCYAKEFRIRIDPDAETPITILK